MDLHDLATTAYLAALLPLALYGLHRSLHVLRFRWPRERVTGASAGMTDELPLVTVQLPLYDERTVAARLLRAVGDLEYPRDRLEVQVLDDSDDETRAIVDGEVAALAARGVDARVIRRNDRSGFKAGALAHGLARARGELVCVFDADFVPRRDFLQRVVGEFRDPRVGMVQARWEHQNREDSQLTRAQSILLDGHFVIEHTVRHAGGLYFNFNGTAGVWRRAAIEDSGGWQHDTLTEDLDLSYRAQLRGWRFVYLPLVVAPAEVPADVAAFKSQQRRWAKGSVQVARKLLGRVLRSEAPLRVKVEACAHLCGNGGYPFVLMLAVLLPLTIRERPRLDSAWHLVFFLLCTVSVVLFYDTGQRALGRSLRDRLRDVPAALALGIGMCVSQTAAVLSGLARGTGVFERTPKRGGAPAAARYRAALRGLPGVELVLAGWFGWSLVRAVHVHSWGSLPFLLLFFSGFAWVGGLSLRGWMRGHRAGSEAARACSSPGGTLASDASCEPSPPPSSSRPSPSRRQPSRPASASASTCFSTSGSSSSGESASA